MARPIKSVDGFVSWVSRLKILRSETHLFRGHPDKRYHLIPSVLRGTWNRRREHIFGRELISQHPSEFASDNTMLERLARMQHYSLPTRLLDVTSNPLVALYFACKERSRRMGEVVALTVKNSDIKYFDSDTASCIANLSQLKPLEKTQLNLSLRRAEFNRSREAKRLGQFIREEKPYFNQEIDPRDLARAIVVRPKFNSRRIVVQAGAFLLFGLRRSLELDSDPRIEITRVRISARDKSSILRKLAILGFSEGTLFPEIESAARHIKQRG